MAKKKKKRGKQGVVSWLTSVFSVFIAMAPAFMAAGEAITQAAPARFAQLMVKWYTGVELAPQTLEYAGYNARHMAVGWGTMLGAIAFKKASSILVKSAKIQSVFPRIS